MVRMIKRWFCWDICFRLVNRRIPVLSLYLQSHTQDMKKLWNPGNVVNIDYLSGQASQIWMIPEFGLIFHRCGLGPLPVGMQCMLIARSKWRNCQPSTLHFSLSTREQVLVSYCFNTTILNVFTSNIDIYTLYLTISIDTGCFSTNDYVCPRKPVTSMGFPEKLKMKPEERPVFINGFINTCLIWLLLTVWNAKCLQAADSKKGNRVEETEYSAHYSQN